MTDQFNRGDQIIYVPSHAAGDEDHHDVEEGFVMRDTEKFVLCRYWSKHDPNLLRTSSCSESTPRDRLILKKTRPQKVVEDMIEMILEVNRHYG